MKRIPATMILGIFTMMLLLHLSCATAKKDQEPPAVSDKAQAAEETVEVEKAPSGPLFLADKHEAAGVSCNDCHEESPPASDVGTEVCMTCHEGFDEVATSYIDPHTAHMVYTNCGDCHHGHRQSENQCMACHSFNLQAP